MTMQLLHVVPKKTVITSIKVIPAYRETRPGKNCHNFTMLLECALLAHEMNCICQDCFTADINQKEN